MPPRSLPMVTMQREKVDLFLMQVNVKPMFLDSTMLEALVAEGVPAGVTFMDDPEWERFPAIGQALSHLTGREQMCVA